MRYNSLDVGFSLECDFLYFGSISQSGGANWSIHEVLCGQVAVRTTSLCFHHNTTHGATGRAETHRLGGTNPWISDGNQWSTSSECGIRTCTGLNICINSTSFNSCSLEYGGCINYGFSERFFKKNFTNHNFHTVKLMTTVGRVSLGLLFRNWR